MKKNGFTLVELLVTLTILGILILFAIPTFKTYQFRVSCLQDTSYKDACFEEKGKVSCGEKRMIDKYCFQLSKEHHGAVYEPNLECERCSVKLQRKKND